MQGPGGSFEGLRRGQRVELRLVGLGFRPGGFCATPHCPGVYQGLRRRVKLPLSVPPEASRAKPLARKTPALAPEPPTQTPTASGFLEFRVEEFPVPQLPEPRCFICQHKTKVPTCLRSFRPQRATKQNAESQVYRRLNLQHMLRPPVLCSLFRSSQRWSCLSAQNQSEVQKPSSSHRQKQTLSKP